MFARVIFWLGLRSSRDLSPADRVKLEDAGLAAARARMLSEAWRLKAEARQAMEDAEARGDTRDLGRAIMWHRRATDDVLRLEVGVR